MWRMLLAAMVLVALAVAAAGCGAREEATQAASDAPVSLDSLGASGRRPSAQVARCASQISRQLSTCPGTSSNPYDYVPYCPAYRKLVALGRPALPGIAHYILDQGASGLDGYVMAIAGDAIWHGHHATAAAQAKSWATSLQWARQYLAWAQEHPSDD